MSDHPVDINKLIEARQMLIDAEARAFAGMEIVRAPHLPPGYAEVRDGKTGELLCTMLIDPQSGAG